MSIISAIDVGERSRGGIGIYDVNRGAVNPGQVYESLLNRRAMPGNNVLNAGAIRAAAAQAANEEKKIALEERKVAVQEADQQQRAIEQNERRRMEERQKQFDRDQAINTEYEKRMTGAQDRYAKDIKTGQEGQVFDRNQDLQARKDTLPQLMQGLYGKNGKAVADWINRFGNPNARVKSVDFADPSVDPKNPDSAMITYEDGSKSYFKNTEDLYKGFLAWTDPNVEEHLSKERQKKEELASKERIAGAKSKLTPEKYAKIHADATTAYNKLYPVDKLTGKRPDDAPDVNDYVKAYKEHAIEQAITAETEGQATVEAGKGQKPAASGYTEFKSPDGRIKREYVDGRVEILKDGKVIAAKDKGGNVINPGTNKKGTSKGPTFDYSTGEMTPEGEAQIEASKQAEITAAQEKTRKAAIEQKKKEPTPTGTAEYTDRSTGHQMRVTVYSDGTTKTEKIESKKKRKKNGKEESSGEE